MKTLLILLLIVACTVLYFHDKQETDLQTKTQTSLDAAQTENSDLTQKVNNLQGQVTNLQGQVTSLQARLQQMAATSSLRPQQLLQQPQHPAPPSPSPLGPSTGLPSTSLDRGSYKN